MQFIKQLFDNRNRDLILDGSNVEIPVINAEVPGVVMFLD